jgi:hypothetical protein
MTSFLAKRTQQINRFHNSNGFNSKMNFQQIFCGFIISAFGTNAE